MFRKHKPNPRVVHIVERRRKDASGASLTEFHAVWNTERGVYIETVATAFSRSEVERLAQGQGFTVATQS